MILPNTMQLFAQSDQTLINKALQGKAGAWQKLVNRHQQHIYNMCYRLMQNPDDAHDLTQEVFIAIYRNLPNYRGDGDFKGWMLRIANNRCIDQLRRKRLFDDIESHPQLDCQKHAPDLHAEQSSRNRLVMQYLNKLPVEQRHIIELKFFQQKTFEQIETMTGTPLSTVKTRFYGAIRQLQKHQELRNAL